MIRKTLHSTQAATFSVLMPDPAHNDFPTPTGTGFFVSPDGLFVTARHVVVDRLTGGVRGDVDKAWLQKETRDFTSGSPLCQSPKLVFDDALTDIAVLQVSFEENANKDWLQGRNGFPFIEVAGRHLEEGEPVYAFGYPLSSGQVQQGPQGMMVGVHTLHPRVTSAVVSSTVEASGALRTSADPAVYVLDKALNYGNSGGPIIASETGQVHAVCTRFQPVPIVQEHLADKSGVTPTFVYIPSLYGIVSSLLNPSVIAFLKSSGASVAAA
jgi:serine protease Do